MAQESANGYCAQQYELYNACLVLNDYDTIRCGESRLLFLNCSKATLQAYAICTCYYQQPNPIYSCANVILQTRPKSSSIGIPTATEVDTNLLLTEPIVPSTAAATLHPTEISSGVTPSFGTNVSSIRAGITPRNPIVVPTLPGLPGFPNLPLPTPVVVPTVVRSPFPVLPTVPAPPVSVVPTVPIPLVPVVPTVPVPSVPVVPTVPVPLVPVVPTVPLPSVPVVPTVPVPLVPVVPTVSVPPVPVAPTISVLPTIPVNFTVPVLTTIPISPTVPVVPSVSAPPTISGLPIPPTPAIPATPRLSNIPTLNSDPPVLPTTIPGPPGSTSTPGPPTTFPNGPGMTTGFPSPPIIPATTPCTTFSRFKTITATFRQVLLPYSTITYTSAVTSTILSVENSGRETGFGVGVCGRSVTSTVY